ncbi:DUF4917 family protein [Paraburkholderia caribensis]|uniref:DUF4917 family protein n=1 Tax=Paraburkholderia caribensis TaxID=75105 RepID=UPI0015920015|nr:DUF4917 family protein [Paraburkholderia caribensis]
MREIARWAEIQARFHHSLIVGNGGSIAIHRGFSYASLFEAARQEGHVTDEMIEIFNAFGVNDFELVLRLLWQATLVNRALKIDAGRVEDAYQRVRSALIETVRSTHVSYEGAMPHLTKLYRFMCRFETVISLNYDLIVYWAAMLGNRDELGRWFKDGFQRGQFRGDWEALREPFGAKGTTMFFYPHGNLVLARKVDGMEYKISAGNDQDLLETILATWQEGESVPLFVCEGTSEHKKTAIGSSRYLQTVATEPLRTLGESVTIYGWSIGIQEHHIIEQLQRSRPERVAVSVHDNDQRFAEHAADVLVGIGVKEVVFFDSASPGCWNNDED